MNLKSLLLGSTAAFIVFSGAQASNVITAKPGPVKNVQACDSYGIGYSYIPGTQICVRLSGYGRSDIGAVGSNSDKLKSGTYDWRSRAALKFQTATKTDLGTLSTFAQLHLNANNGSASADLYNAYIQLGGFHVGYDDTAFYSWTGGGYGSVLNDSSITPAETRTNMISYTFNAGNGLSAILSAEQGAGHLSDNADIDADGKNLDKTEISDKIDSYIPNIVAGLKYAQGWGSASAVVAYDSYYEKWAAKIRADVDLTSQWNLWAMMGYKSAKDMYYITSRKNDKGQEIVSHKVSSMYGDWGGDWAAWAGTTYKFNPKTNFNAQLSFDGNSTFAAVANVNYKIASNLTLTPEIAYLSHNKKDFGGASKNEYRDEYKGKNALKVMARLQRSF